jgi:Mg2+/Co2+ transporter CorB
MDVTLDTAFWLTAGAIFGLLILSGFFSGSETALTAASRAKLKASADKGEAGSAAAMNVTEDSERMIGAILLGNNVVNILSASLATALLTRLFGDSGVALATLGMTLLVLIFGEVLPKTYAIANPETVARRVAPVIRVLIFLFAPVVSVVRVLVRGVLLLFGVRTDPDRNILAVREEIMGVISLGHSEGAVEKEDRDRLLATLDLSDRTVEEVMRHRSTIEMIDAEEDPDSIMRQVLASSHTRFPIYRGDKENIVGQLHAKDLWREVDRLVRKDNGNMSGVSELDLMKVARKPYFIPETTALDDQMRQFLKRETHFALVVDEYGALRGLVTLEDILEEIVGDITDEFDPTRQDGITPTEAGDYIIDGTRTIRDVNRALDWSLPDEEANTIAGLVIHEAQMIPAEGQVFSFHGFRFKVLERKENRISRLQVTRLGDG